MRVRVSPAIRVRARALALTTGLPLGDILLALKEGRSIDDLEDYRSGWFGSDRRIAPLAERESPLRGAWSWPSW